MDQDLFLRYERLLLQTTLDTMNDIVYCPLSHCQAPVIIDQDESLGQCPSCSYAFCVFCKLAYHGISPCKVSAGRPLFLYCLPCYILCGSVSVAQDNENSLGLALFNGYFSLLLNVRFIACVYILKPRYSNVNQHFKLRNAFCTLLCFAHTSTFHPLNFA